MPRYRLREVDHLAVAADPARTFSVVRSTDLYRLSFARRLFALRLVPDVLERNAKESLQTLARQVPPALFGGSQVHIGTAWQVICRTARELDADLIVIGSHGYGGIERVLGTTAARVVNHADRSVLVARPRVTA
ncbi:MAG TPA: universal stress protein [Polyangia bacterium]|nr:universal stress protein [Polyangia bacterium]